MATTKEFLQYVLERLSEAEGVTYRPMFGEYGLYANGKFFGAIEDNALYIKITEQGKALLEDPVIASPHEGAVYFEIRDLQDKKFLKNLIEATCEALPLPKKRKK